MDANSGNPGPALREVAELEKWATDALARSYADGYSGNNTSIQINCNLALKMVAVVKTAQRVYEADQVGLHSPGTDAGALLDMQDALDALSVALAPFQEKVSWDDVQKQAGIA